MKRLKGCVAALMGALCIGSCLVACGDSSRDTSGQSVSSKASDSAEKFVGDWEGKGSVFSRSDTEITFTFNNSGTGSFQKESARDSQSFNWNISGNNLIITQPDGRYPYTQSYEFSNNDRTLTLVFHSDDDGQDYTYTYYRIN